MVHIYGRILYNGYMTELRKEKQEQQDPGGINSSQPDESPTVGQLLRAARHGAGLSLGAVAARTGLAKSVVDKAERDLAQQPSPTTLAKLAEALKLNLADVYAAAGYDAPSELPTFAPYLRSKYRDLPPAARAELEQSFARVAAKYGVAATGPAPGEDEQDVAADIPSSRTEGHKA